MKKSKGVAYLLWFLSIFGWLGFHRFYLGRWGTAILWILTFGLFEVGSFIDLFTLGGKVEMYNAELENKEFKREMRENMMLTNSTVAAAAATAISASSVASTAAANAMVKTQEENK